MANVDQETVKGLLHGAYDLHIHSAPDVLPRKFDDAIQARHAVDSGMSGFVIKNHYGDSSGRAALVREQFPGLNVFGAICLNNAVGGLNPIAVDIAGRMGAKVVWLPTVDSANELANIAGQLDESKLPYWMSIAREMRALGIQGEPIRVVDDNGKVTKPTLECLERIAHHDMILATGHINPNTELLPVIKAAKEAGVRRIVVTHPEFPTTFLSIEQQKEVASYGAYMERCFTTPFTNKVAWETVFENIKQVGASSTVISTDLGQATAPWVEEGLGIFFGRLLEAGISETDIQRMAGKNAAQLLGVQ